MHTLHEVQDTAVAAQAGDPALLKSLILPVDAAVPELPLVVIRDAAVDAVCRGAHLAAVGVISMKEFRQGDTVAVLSQKNEFVCLGRALVPSVSFKPGDTGLVIAPTTVFMQPGTYPKGWTKSGKIFAEKKKPEKKAPKPQDRRTAGRQERGGDRNRFRKSGPGPVQRPAGRDTIKKIPGIPIGYTFS